MKSSFKNILAVSFLLCVFAYANFYVYFTENPLQNISQKDLAHNIAAKNHQSNNTSFDPFEENEEEDSKDKDGDDELFSMCFLLVPFVINTISELPTSYLNAVTASPIVLKQPLFLSYRTLLI